jgi:PhnB protein
MYQQPGLAEREATLDPIPEHVRAVTPRIVVRNGAEAIDFYCRAFGAQEVGDRFTGPDGGLIHGEVRIGDSIVAITEEAGDAGPARAPESVGGVVTAIISTYWENVDPAWERALSAGAEVLYPLADHFYGERGGRLRDPFGHQWMLSQRIEDLTHEEIVRRAQKEFSGASGG